MFNYLTDTRTMAKVVIYARVSTQGQDYERQLAELREYARKMEYEVVMEFCEKVSGAKTVAERQALTELLKEGLNAVIKRMDSVQDKYIDGDIDKETYNRIIERYSREADSVKERIALLETQNNAKIEPKMGYAISLINNIDRFILDAPVALKIKLLGSMFPQKIEFDGNKY